MSLPMNIGTGSGLAGGTGVRPFLPPLLAGALARGNDGIDFSHTPYSFLESTGFLVAVLALAVIAYLADRRRRAGAEAGRDPVALGMAVLGLALGALLFAGTIAQSHEASWWGIPAGIVCAALGYTAVALLFGRARRRVEGGAAALIDAYAEVIALVVAGLSIAWAPLGYVALAIFLVLIVRARASGDRKFEGLRILR